MDVKRLFEAALQLDLVRQALNALQLWGWGSRGSLSTEAQSTGVLENHAVQVS